MLQHVMSSADVFASCMQGLGIGEKIIGVLYNKLKGSVSPFSLLLKKSSLKYQWNYFLTLLSIFLLPCSKVPISKFHSPFILTLGSIRSCSSCSSSSSRSAVKSSGGGKVPERKGKQRDTLYLAFSALPRLFHESHIFFCYSTSFI